MKAFSSTITFLQTNDLKKTSDFYEQNLQCKLILDQGQCRIFETSKNAYIGFCSHDFLEKNQNTVCLTFVCNSKEEVDIWYEKLKEKKVPIKACPAENQKFKIYNFFATDPNGISIEVQYFLHKFPPDE
ncbi:MAG: VOC family protein [Candidatus Heimdallarchaeota archaeon]